MTAAWSIPLTEASMTNLVCHSFSYVCGYDMAMRHRNDIVLNVPSLDEPALYSSGSIFTSALFHDLIKSMTIIYSPCIILLNY